MPIDKNKIVPKLPPRAPKTPQERQVYALIIKVQKKSNGKPRELYSGED